MGGGGWTAAWPPSPPLPLKPHHEIAAAYHRSEPEGGPPLSIPVPSPAFIAKLGLVYHGRPDDDPFPLNLSTALQRQRDVHNRYAFATYTLRDVRTGFEAMERARGDDRAFVWSALPADSILVTHYRDYVLRSEVWTYAPVPTQLLILAWAYMFRVGRPGGGMTQAAVTFAHGVLSPLIAPQSSKRWLDQLTVILWVVLARCVLSSFAYLHPDGGYRQS